MPNVLLIHWDPNALDERAERLERAGYDVAICAKDGSAAFRAVGASAPHAVVIDLSRQPSHGKRLAVALREKKTTRHLPLVFVEGTPEAVADLKRALPEAAYTNWRGVASTLKRAIAKAPVDWANVDAAPVAKKIAQAAPLGAGYSGAGYSGAGYSGAGYSGAGYSGAGYSGTPLPKKLGIKEGSRVALLSAPAGLTDQLGALPHGARLQDHVKTEADVVLLFGKNLRDVEKRFGGAVKALASGGGLWIGWPKKSSGVATDLDEDTIRAVGLAEGLVDNKVCAIDTTWSGLRFMRRRKS